MSVSSSWDSFNFSLYLMCVFVCIPLQTTYAPPLYGNFSGWVTASSHNHTLWQINSKLVSQRQSVCTADTHLASWLKACYFPLKMNGFGCCFNFFTVVLLAFTAIIMRAKKPSPNLALRVPPLKSASTNDPRSPQKTPFACCVFVKQYECAVWCFFTKRQQVQWTFSPKLKWNLTHPAHGTLLLSNLQTG